LHAVYHACATVHNVTQYVSYICYCNHTCIQCVCRCFSSSKVVLCTMSHNTYHTSATVLITYVYIYVCIYIYIYIYIYIHTHTHSTRDIVLYTMSHNTYHTSATAHNNICTLCITHLLLCTILLYYLRNTYTHTIYTYGTSRIPAHL